VRENKKEAAHQFEVAELRRKAKDFHQPRPVGWNKPAIHRRYTERRFFCIPYRYLQGITPMPLEPLPGAGFRCKSFKSLLPFLETFQNWPGSKLITTRRFTHKDKTQCRASPNS
jgi:hypothetical protein